MLTFSSNPDLAEQQMHAIIFYLTAFGYIDGDFDASERAFVKIYIQQLVEARAKSVLPDQSDNMRSELTSKFVTHFHEVFEQTDATVQSWMSEVVADGEKVEDFVYAKLKLRSYEIFRSFDENNQRELMETVDELINADGKVHPAEAKFRDEIEALLDADDEIELTEIEVIENKVPEIDAPTELSVNDTAYPFLASEDHYSKDPEVIRAQAEKDAGLIKRTMAQLDDQRKGNTGKLIGVNNVAAFDGEAPFLDGHTYVHPVDPNKTYELTILGDLHGCYSCLKGALMQSNFFAKLEAYRLGKDAVHPVLVLLGDYIDRGRFSYNGVLRAVMNLYNLAPEHVFMLRGNHEYYVEYKGRIYGGVKPAEAINTLYEHMPKHMFENYMKLFEAMPNTLLFDRTFFVHGGIPRDSAIKAKWDDLSSLNDPDLRFQMLWSDPSEADFIPEELQEQNARFPFGRKQFERFMQKLGCHAMVRGHEKIDAGFASVYPDNKIPLLNLFSAGGEDNDDLPENSSYRTVTPMALTMTLHEGESKVTPWPINYKPFNDPERNRFFATQPEIEHQVG